MDIYTELAKKIIKAQEDIVGAVALDLANKVSGVKVGNSSQEVALEGDEKDTVNRLIKQYEGLFGQVSLEVCKRAAKSMTMKLPKEQLPPLLA
jgi:hypothetical protein